jgi:osmoprotectant transport system ATP-binding protein
LKGEWKDLSFTFPLGTLGNTMSAIVIEQVSKRFAEQGRAAVDDCSMSVAAGEFVVLLGPSGCGKTTLLKMVNRLYEPTSGRIQIDGVDVRDLPATTLRRRIGYVIQQTGLFPHMPVAANIAVVPRLLGWERGRIEARIDELLALVGLPVEYRTRYPRQLSARLMRSRARACKASCLPSSSVCKKRSCL